MKYVRYSEEKQRFYIKSWPHPSWMCDGFYFPDNMTEDDAVFWFEYANRCANTCVERATKFA